MTPQTNPHYGALAADNTITYAPHGRRPTCRRTSPPFGPRSARPRGSRSSDFDFPFRARHPKWLNS